MWWRYCYFTICRKKTREKNLGIFSHQIHLSNSRCQWSVGACSSSVLHLGFWFIWRLHPIYIIVTSLLHYNWTISLTSQPHDITTLLAHKLHLLWYPFADQPRPPKMGVTRAFRSCRHRTLIIELPTWLDLGSDLSLKRDIDACWCFLATIISIPKYKGFCLYICNYMAKISYSLERR